MTAAAPVAAGSWPRRATCSRLIQQPGDSLAFAGCVLGPGHRGTCLPAPGHGLKATPS